MTAPVDGAVYDRGYRPYDGPRGGRGAARLALGRLSVRRALGLRRSWKQKVFPFVLLGIAVVPAVVNVGVKYLTRDSPLEDFDFISYRDYVGAPVSLLLFIALAAPDIVCPDRRNRMLPLIFARPLTGADYVLTKVASMVVIVFGFGLFPHVVLFVGQMLVARGGALGYARENAEVLWQVPVSVAAVAVFYATIAIALSSLTTRRMVGAVSFLGLMLISNALASIIQEVGDGPSMWALLDVLNTPLHVRDLVFLGHVSRGLEGVPGAGAAVLVAFVVEVGVAVVVLLRRYREVQL